MVFVPIRLSVQKSLSEGRMNPTTSHSENTYGAERRRAERRNSPSLAAYHWKGPIPRQNTVRDISATGAFLLTQERWEPGEIIALTLQRSGPPERDNSFSVQARAVRWDEQGVAISFVLPTGADLRLWQSPLKSAAEQNEVSIFYFPISNSGPVGEHGFDGGVEPVFVEGVVAVF